MVKILDNQLIDLDVMPGLKPSDLLAKAEALQAQSPEKADALRQLAAQRAAGLLAEVDKKTAGIDVGAAAGKPQGQQQIPEGQQGQEGEQQQQQQGGLVEGAKGVGMGLTNTVGSLGKGVGDTLGNTLYTLGSGLAGTGKGVAGGLTQTGKSAVGQGGEVQEEDLYDPAMLEQLVAATKRGAAANPGADPAVLEQLEKAQKDSERRKPKKIEIRSGEKEDEEGGSKPNEGGKKEEVKLVDKEKKDDKEDKDQE